MALVKKKNSKYYYAVIYVGNYKHKWISTKTTDKKIAQTIHDELQDHYQKLTTKHELLKNIAKIDLS